VVVIVAFVLVSAIIHFRRDQGPYLKRASLSQAVSALKGWKLEEIMKLDPNIIDSLELDDFLNQNYTNGNSTVSLYLGYYMTSKKVGAAHSPLVCFPGQGWLVSDKTEASMQIGDQTIHYSSIVVSKGQIKSLVVYWFQAGDKTSSGTFFQKVNLLLAKFYHSREDNAFVRVSISMNGRSKQESFQEIKHFIRAFYPKLLEYLWHDNIVTPPVITPESKH
jgi:EpsI family protein